MDKIRLKKNNFKKKVNPKLLVGTWVNEQETDEFSKQRIYKANGSMDYTPYNDICNYKVVDNAIKYSKGKNAVPEAQKYTDDKITSLTKTELVLNGGLKFKRVK